MHGCTNYRNSACTNDRLPNAPIASFLVFVLARKHKNEHGHRPGNLAEQGRAGNISRLAAVKGWVLDRARHARGTPLRVAPRVLRSRGKPAPLTATARADRAEIAGTRSASSRPKARDFRPASGGPNKERGRGEPSSAANRRFPETPRRGEIVRAIEFDTDESARELPGGDQCRARTAEGIEHDAARPAFQRLRCILPNFGYAKRMRS